MDSKRPTIDKQSTAPIRVAVIGTVGVPACYGGFETLVEQLILNKNREDIEYTIYCSSPSYPKRINEFQGAKLRYIPLKANGIQSIPYDILSIIKAASTCDVMLILGVSGCIFLPIFRIFSNKKIVINIDGLEHKRDKWKPWVKRFLKYSEKCAVRLGSTIISDNQGIADYVKEEYGRDTEMIPYGGDQAVKSVSPEIVARTLRKYGVEAGQYAIALCRIEPENNVEMILEAFTRIPGTPLIFIGNWHINEFGRRMRSQYSEFKNIQMKDAVYDRDIINALRANCKIYLHGHSAGGTNPSLVEAMFFGKPIFAYDVGYNRHSTENSAIYFSSAENIRQLIASEQDDKMQSCGEKMKKIATRLYRWESITEQYENLY